MSDMNEGRYTLEQAQIEGFRMQERIKDEIVNNYPDADFLANLELSPSTELREVNFEQLRQLVAYPGTMTHVTRTSADIKGGLNFWFDLANGKARKREKAIETDTDTGVALHVTLPDGSNPSIEGSDFFSLKSGLGDKVPYAIVIFSIEALDKVSNDFYKTGITPDNYTDVIHRIGFDQNKFAEFLAARGIDYQKVSEDWELTISPSLQINLMMYLQACKQYPPEVLLDNSEMVNQGYNFAIKNIEYHSQMMRDFGYRYRGVFKQGKDYIWGDLEVKPEDVAAIAIPIIKGNKYAITRFKGRPTILDVEGKGFDSVL